MIEINLLPEDRRKAKDRFKGIDFSEFKLKDAAILGMIGVVFGILIVFQIILVLSGLVVRSNLSSIEKQYNTILSQKKEADTLKSEIDLVNKKVRAIDELMVNRFSWAKKLSDLNYSMIPGVWLSELDYAETGGNTVVAVRPDGKVKTVSQKASARYLALDGYALNAGDEGNALIGKFIKSLKHNAAFYADFSDIQLGFTKSEKLKEQDVVNFKITCLYKEKTK